MQEEVKHTHIKHRVAYAIYTYIIHYYGKKAKYCVSHSTLHFCTGHSKCSQSRLHGAKSYAAQ